MNGWTYFELFDDMSGADRWFLSPPTGPSGEWLGTALGRGERFVGQTPLRMEVYRSGPSLDLTVTEGGVLVVTASVADLLVKEAGEDVQLVPAEIQGHAAPHFVANVLPLRKCIDEQRTTAIERWAEEDGRPERVGQYRYVGGMKIDPERTGGHAILRPWGWTGVILVSQALAEALRRAGVRCQLIPVT